MPTVHQSQFTIHLKPHRRVAESTRPEKYFCHRGTRSASADVTIRNNPSAGGLQREAAGALVKQLVIDYEY